jgi:small subunit ribosomal protein S17
MKRVLRGLIVSDCRDKTVTVCVRRVSRHPVYHKDITTSKKYSAHDEANHYRIGQEVLIRESKPFSKTKTWEVVGLVEGGKS